MERFIKNTVTIANLDVPYIQNFRLFRTQVCQLLLNVSANSLELLTYCKGVTTRCLLPLLYPVLFIKNMTYSLTIDFFSYSLLYQLQGS